jgi:hypothetical protein
MLSVCAPRVVVREELRQLALSASIEATDHYRKGHLYLIRPDAYVALSTREGEIAAHVDKLRSFAAPPRPLREPGVPPKPEFIGRTDQPHS